MNPNFSPDRFSLPSKAEEAYCATLVEDLTPLPLVDGDDLANELDSDVCAVLLALLDRGQFEAAGRALEAIRAGQNKRFAWHAEYGWRGGPVPDMPEALQIITGVVAGMGLEITDGRIEAVRSGDKP
jgi:hypothetical protein